MSEACCAVLRDRPAMHVRRQRRAHPAHGDPATRAEYKSMRRRNTVRRAGQSSTRPVVPTNRPIESTNAPVRTAPLRLSSTGIATSSFDPTVFHGSRPSSAYLCRPFPQSARERDMPVLVRDLANFEQVLLILGPELDGAIKLPEGASDDPDLLAVTTRAGVISSRSLPQRDEGGPPITTTPTRISDRTPTDMLPKRALRPLKRSAPTRRWLNGRNDRSARAGAPSPNPAEPGRTPKGRHRGGRA